MADAGAQDLTNAEARQDLIRLKTPRQVAGLYQWWAARQTDRRLVTWVRHQIILEMSEVHGYQAAAEFLRALIGQ